MASVYVNIAVPRTLFAEAWALICIVTHGLSSISEPLALGDYSCLTPVLLILLRAWCVTRVLACLIAHCLPAHPPTSRALASGHEHDIDISNTQGFIAAASLLLSAVVWLMRVAPPARAPDARRGHGQKYRHREWAL